MGDPLLSRDTQKLPEVAPNESKIQMQFSAGTIKDLNSCF